MARRTLAELTATFQSKGISDSTGAWKNYFPFWKAPVDSETTVRFLPDLNTENPMGFLVEKITHELQIEGKKVSVLCGRAHNEDQKCPFCSHSASFYAAAEIAKKTGDAASEAALAAEGKKWYKKKAYLGQVLVVSTNANDLGSDVGKVKLIEVGPQLFKIMQAGFSSGDMDEVPFDYAGGYNFVFRKKQNGKFANYDTSSFRFKQAAIEPEVLSTVVQPALVNLAEHITDLSERQSYEGLQSLFAACKSQMKSLNDVTIDDGVSLPSETPDSPPAENAGKKVSEILRERKLIPATATA